MRIIRSNQELAEALRGTRPSFVPTMGALHAGHLALIRRAGAIAKSQPVVLSIFVNPTQFGPDEDFKRYPRTLGADVAGASSAGADIVFAPDVESIYPEHSNGSAPDVRWPGLPDVATQPKLEDAHRPTHFAGVCQVVARLFDLVQPSVVVFGEKDYQQLLVIKAMVKHEDQRWRGLRVEAHPTVREPDGLAMSSRNAYLRPKERERALGLFRALRAAQQTTGPEAAEQIMRQSLEGHELQIDYAAARDAATLMPIESFNRPARALIAARLGSVRLIDNMPVGQTGLAHAET